MKEVVCINVGQCGIQMSNAAWELFCIEHGIQANGQLRQSLAEDDSVAFTTFFQEVPTGQFVPRVISIDLEPTVIDEVRTGAYRNLFHPDQLLSGFEDAANNFARGHFTIGKTMIDSAMSQIRRAVEACEYMQNFFILNSFGGGTGAGFTSLLLDRLGVEYTNRYRVQLVCSLSPVLTTSCVEPYNASLTIHSAMDHTDLAILTDNEASYYICLNTLDIPRPTYANLNRLIAQVFSDMTASVRFEGSLSSDMDQLTTNLVPYPRIHFPIMSHAPNISENRAEHQQMTIVEITRMVFERDCTLVTCQPKEGRYMSCCMQYRGDVTPKDVNQAIYEMKKRTDIKFVQWCPTGFKLGINSQPPVCVPASEMAQTSRSVSMLTNTSAINQAWIGLNRKFDLIFAKRAFVHWFVGEGMEEGEMNEARDDVTVLMADYEEITQEEEVEEGDDYAAPATPAATSGGQKSSVDGGERNDDDENEGDDDDYQGSPGGGSPGGSPGGSLDKLSTASEVDQENEVEDDEEESESETEEATEDESEDEEESESETESETEDTASNETEESNTETMSTVV